jgi:hypothetical protein
MAFSNLAESGIVTSKPAAAVPMFPFFFLDVLTGSANR